MVGNAKETSEGLQNLFELYNQSITKMEFSGPTFFEPILEKVFNDAVAKTRKNPYHYSVMLIITDGIIHDMEETVELLVEHSKDCGVSIIIVGVGNEDFSDMRKLDGDDVVLTDVNGKKAVRDLV